MAKENLLKAERTEQTKGAAVPQAPLHVAERAGKQWGGV